MGLSNSPTRRQAHTAYVCVCVCVANGKLACACVHVCWFGLWITERSLWLLERSTAIKLPLFHKSSCDYVIAPSFLLSFSLTELHSPTHQSSHLSVYISYTLLSLQSSFQSIGLFLLSFILTRTIPVLRKYPHRTFSWVDVRLAEKKRNRWQHGSLLKCCACIYLSTTLCHAVYKWLLSESKRQKRC